MPPAAWILFGGSFVNRFGSFVLVFLVLYLTDEGFSPAEAGAAVSAYGAGGLGAALLGGWLADRLGRRNTIALSMFSAAATMLALSQARGLAPVVVLSGAAGLTSELYRPASAALLTDLLPPGRRITGFALYRLAHRGAARRARPGRSRRPCLPALPPRVACPPPSSTSNSRPRFPSTSPTRASRTPSSEHFSL
jgi:MFS family permease